MTKLHYQEFLRPIVTPFELGIALQPEPQWTGAYELDFKKILESDTLLKLGMFTLSRWYGMRILIILYDRDQW